MMLETDGVGLCAHFKRSKTLDELREDERHKGEAAKSKLATADRKAARERSPERVKQERNAKRAKTVAEKKAAKAAAVEKGVERPENTQAPDGLLSQDPGVNPNVTYTVHIVNGRKVRRRFTIGRWYKESGVTRLQKLTTGWLKGIQREQATLDEISLKTADHSNVRAHVRRYALVHRRLWDEKTKLRWSRGRFDTYVRKPASLDKFFNEIKADGPVTRNLYGDAQCASSIPGCKPAPRSLCRRRAAMAFGGEEAVDEYLTTQCCWKCGARTQPVAVEATDEERANGRRRRTVRGLVFCDSRTCGHFTNRDFQGAMNIMACGVGPRPAHLARTVQGVRRTDVRLTTTQENASFGGGGNAVPPYTAQLGHSHDVRSAHGPSIVNIVFVPPVSMAAWVSRF
jgi:hypothetical protein